ncbi:MULTISPECIES: hypothetical protein [Sphingomonas]|uniref:hypothetical protein n=1 Tax=Sphingomonas TaxID=13687 RepID=UPI0006F7B575|nr:MULTISPECIES: hypothetical protein [Sphingomonas]KQM99767.1 hypothetical protein ASE77_02120 [Sphingomonas sp. Leaf226]MDY0965815.1 hypothetical protein [Sphingomonas sp. CFBP9021]USQ99471.1 hypothetical protein NEF64_13715 [Sphingomonas aerolata]
MTGPRFDRYDWAGGRETMLRFGPDAGPLVVAVLPLFEEANRTRAFLVEMLRALARRGIGSILPDLPGTDESVVETRDLRLADLRQAFATLVGTLDAPVYALTIRSGALVDCDASLAGRWRLAPQAGDDLLRDLNRIRAASTMPDADGYAGNSLSAALLADLRDAVPCDASRTVRLESDPRPADARYPGAPLWRRSEPGSDATLSDTLAADIAGWIAACAG